MINLIPNIVKVNHQLMMLIFFISVSLPCVAQDDDDGIILTILQIASQLSQEQSSPNILFIIADDLGTDASNQYDSGAEKPVTPTLDMLANEGLIFDNFWASPSCSPTRAALLTGKYGFRTDVLVPGNILDPLEEVIQEYIRANASVDYAQAVIGKWHLSGNDANHPLDTGVEYYSGALEPPDAANYFNWTLTTNGQTTSQSEYSTTVFTDEAITWVSEQDKPWFLWLAYTAPHSPFHLPPTDLHTQDLPGTQEDIDNNPRDYYFAMIEAMDTEIGRLLDAIPQEQLDNTIIFFIGDNGTPGEVAQAPFTNGHAKGSLYQGGIRVPMFVSGKGVTRIGEREDALINHTDFYSTIAALTGITISQVNDSVSFVDLLSNGNTGARDFLYTDHRTAEDEEPEWTIRNQQYKLINFNDGSQNLYDLLIDEFEQTNLIMSGDQSSIITELEAINTQLKQ